MKDNTKEDLPNPYESIDSNLDDDIVKAIKELDEDYCNDNPYKMNNNPEFNIE